MSENLLAKGGKMHEDNIVDLKEKAEEKLVPPTGEEKSDPSFNVQHLANAIAFATIEQSIQALSSLQRTWSDSQSNKQEHNKIR